MNLLQAKLQNESAKGSKTLSGNMNERGFLFCPHPFPRLPNDAVRKGFPAEDGLGPSPTAVFRSQGVTPRAAWRQEQRVVGPDPGEEQEAGWLEACGLLPGQ